MKEELKDLLKESLEEEEETHPMDEATPEEEEEKDMSGDDDASSEEEDTELDTDDDTDLDNADEPTGEFGSEEDADSDVEDGEYPADSEMDTDADTDSDMGLDANDDVDSDDDVMDMTGASDEEVIRVFKKMKPEDGIVVKKDGNTVEFQDGDNDYVIKLDENEESHDETLYEIDLDEEEEEETEEEVHEEKHPGVKGHGPKKVSFEPAKKGFDEKKSHVNPLKNTHKPKKFEFSEEEEGTEEKIEATEAARTKSNPHGDKNGMDRAGIKSKKMYKAGSSINEEVETLKKQNAEYKKALVLFKDKLNEVAVFNANLAYATRLFTENSTTKTEKLNILKRFDTVSSLQESKSLFNTIQSELSTKTTTVAESVAEKISSTPSTSSSTEVLSEAKAYENPQFSRMKDLMKKLK
jgi:hypothetical protein